MAQLILITADGIETAVEAQIGYSIMEIIRDGGSDDLLALCGGCCSCATCQVYIDPAFVDRLLAMSNDEHELLDTAEGRNACSRLSCQIAFEPSLDGMRVHIPKS